MCVCPTNRLVAVTYAFVADQSAANLQLGSANVTTNFWWDSTSRGPVADGRRLVGERSGRGRTPHRSGRRLRYSDVGESVGDRRSV